MTVERVTSAQGLIALEGEWQALLSLRPRWLPFETPQWHAAWWTNLRENKPWVHDALFTCAIRTRGGALVGVAPLMATKRPGLGPVGFRAIDFIGPDPNLTELRSVVCHPEMEGAVFKALRQYLHQNAREWHWIHWRGLKVGGEAERSLQGVNGSIPASELESYVVHLPATWEELRASRSRNLKESLRKCYNSLRRDGHAFSFAVARTPEEVQRAVDRLFRLHRARALVSEKTVVHRDLFSAEASRAFVHDACRRLAERSSTRVFELCIGEEVVASRIGFVLGDSLYLYYSGYDPNWADYSVMTTTVAESMKYAISMGLKEVNLSFGTDVSKTRWSPERRVYRELVEPSPSRRGRFAYPAYVELRRLMRQKRMKGLVGRVLGRRAKKVR